MINENQVEIQGAKALETEGAQIVATATALKILSNEQYEDAGAELIRIKQAQNKVVELFDPAVKKAHEAHKAILASKSQLLDPLEKAAKLITEEMKRYNAEVKRLAEEFAAKAKADAEASAKKERERIEALAEKELNQGTKKTVLLSTELDKLIARKNEIMLSLDVQNASDDVKVELLTLQRVISLKQEQIGAVQESALVKAENILEKADQVIKIPVAPVIVAPKAKGISGRGKWVAIITDSKVVPISVNGIEIRPINESQLNKIGNMSGGKAVVPGVRFEYEEIIVARAK